LLLQSLFAERGAAGVRKHLLVKIDIAISNDLYLLLIRREPTDDHFVVLGREANGSEPDRPGEQR
jgi:hypothetical protein